MSTSNTPYITAFKELGWLVRVPVGYTDVISPKRLRYRQRLFSHAQYDGAIQSFEAATLWRDLNRLAGLPYNSRHPSSSNGRQVSNKIRIRGADLPEGITDTLQISKHVGRPTRLITVQVMCDKKSRTKSFCYGHSRTRGEAVALAKIALATFLSEIEETLAGAGHVLASHNSVPMDMDMGSQVYVSPRERALTDNETKIRDLS